MESIFNGKRVLVTGGARGIGLALSKRLHSYGAKVVAIGRNQSNLDALASECKGIEVASVDLNNWDETKEKVESLGTFDFLINNAGIMPMDHFLNIKPEDFDSVFNTNVKALINVSQVVAQKMIDNKISGGIINFSSMASKRVMPAAGVYCATKAAVNNLTKTMASELGKHGIRVNAIAPSTVHTDMLSEGMGRAVELGFDPQQSLANMLARLPLQNVLMDMDHLVNTTLFLLAAKEITGQVVVQDNGYMAS